MDFVVGPISYKLKPLQFNKPSLKLEGRSNHQSWCKVCTQQELMNRKKKLLAYF